jgi:HPr kinase/phosphorylase
MTKHVSVQYFIDNGLKLNLSVQAGKGGLNREVTSSQPLQLGLALTGHLKHKRSGALQILGRPEMAYFNSLEEKERLSCLTNILSLDMACLVVTREQRIPDIFLAHCDTNNIPLISSPLSTSEFITRAQWCLQSLLSQTASIHGVLMDVYGLGVLLRGHSGIGKSESALDLIMRGHKLVADDIIDITRRADILLGKGYHLIKHHMEVRGIGIINVKDLFGVTSVRDAKKIELCIELVDWEEDGEYDRLGIDENYLEILNVPIPQVVIPVRPGRNVSVIVEVATRNQLLKMGGQNSALEFQEKLMSRIASGHTSHPQTSDLE